ncbi:MAG: hypothetical protein RLZZ511_3280 [Cyanobacteriota bacterium]|jgi:hypothetical protein
MTRSIAFALGLLNAISIFFLLQINVGLFPLLPSSLPEDRISKINGLVSDLCQGIVVSTFFYFLLVYLPEQEKARRVKALIQPRLRSIVEMMEPSLLYVLIKSGQPQETLKEASLDAFSSFPGITGAKMNFKYQVLYDDRTWVSFEIPHTDVEYFQYQHNYVCQGIETLLSLPHIADENNGLVDLLPRLRDCQFYATVKSTERFGANFAAPELTQDIYDYWYLYSKLRKISEPRSIRITPDI